MIVAKSKLEDPGIGPRTSLMQSERSTTSANPPTTKS